MIFSDKPPLAALVVSSSEKGTDAITNALGNGRFSPVTTVKSAGEAKRLMLYSTFDIVIINLPLPDEAGYDFALSICESGPAGVLMLVRGEAFYDIAPKAGEYGIFTLQKPISNQLLSQAIQLMAATRERMRLLEKENSKLRVKIEEIKIINLAKWALIEYLKMTENQAHRYIEKQAMDMRVTRREVAESIIKMYQY